MGSKTHKIMTDSGALCPVGLSRLLHDEGGSYQGAALAFAQELHTALIAGDMGWERGSTALKSLAYLREMALKPQEATGSPAKATSVRKGLDLLPRQFQGGEELVA